MNWVTNMTPSLSHAILSALALVFALWVDVCWGEPPVRWHPVAWMGNFLERTGHWAAPESDAAVNGCEPAAWVRGFLAWWLGAVFVVGLAWGLQMQIQQASPWIAVPCLGLLLKPLLAWRMLRDEVTAVEGALANSLAAGRERLAWLCSRDVDQLDAVQVRETAIETLAENLSDSLVAPLFWFALWGLPGAALYRFANTADAMWGYHGERSGRQWEWAGKWAARTDDVLSWLPARLTSALLVLASGRLYVPGLRHEAKKTPSPNGGWPMGAMALLLNVRLSKSGVYLLHARGNAVRDGDIERACRFAVRAVWMCVPLCCLVLGAFHG